MKVIIEGTLEEIQYLLGRLKDPAIDVKHVDIQQIKTPKEREQMSEVETTTKVETDQPSQPEGDQPTAPAPDENDGQDDASGDPEADA